MGSKGKTASGRRRAAAVREGGPGTTVLSLTYQEMRVLRHISRGLVNKEIARELKVSVNTVKNHIASIFRKLNVNTRTEALVKAVQRGFVRI